MTSSSDVIKWKFTINYRISKNGSYLIIIAEVMCQCLQEAYYSSTDFTLAFSPALVSITDVYFVHRKCLTSTYIFWIMLKSVESDFLHKLDVHYFK